MRRALLLCLAMSACRNTAPAPPAPEAKPTSAIAPEEVCTHAVDIGLSDLDAKPSVGERDALRADCMKEAEKELAEAPSVYACEAPCVMAAKTFAELDTCYTRCKPPGDGGAD